MELVVTIIHVFTALFMILVVLVQGGNSGGVGAAFGGGNSQGVFGAGGATSFLGKLTYFAAGVFMITSISLSVMQGHSGKTGLKQRLQKSEATQQTVPAVPAPAAPASGNQGAPSPAGPGK